MSDHAPHTAKSIFVGCIDDRLSEAHLATIKQVGGSFHAMLAGGGAAFLNEEDCPTAIKQVLAARKINQITDVYVESHTDCGAYRLSGVTFDSPEDEIKRLYRDLDAAAEVIGGVITAAGAAPDEVTVHVQVTGPTGEPVARLS